MRFFSVTLLLLLFASSYALQAQTNVSGTFGVDQHWTLAGSPYVVTGAYRILPGTTLRIDPGVAISFAGAFTIRVQGGIEALGNAAQPITVNAANTTLALDLDSLDVLACQLDHVHFSGGNTALRVFESSNPSQNIQSTGCRFQDTGLTIAKRYQGFELMDAILTDAQVVVSSDVFTDSRAEFRNSQFRRCTFLVNDTPNMSAYTSLGISSSQLHDCVFTGHLISSPIGLDLLSDTLYGCAFHMIGGEVHAENSAFVDCYFGNQGLGIQNSHGYRLSGFLNRFMNCALTLSDSATIGEVSLSDCLVQNDGLAGLKVQNAQLVDVAIIGSGVGDGLQTDHGSLNHCTFQGHDKAVRFHLKDFFNAFAADGCNFLESQTLHMACDSAIFGEAKNCWWQETDSAAIEALIYDAMDNPLLGQVDYMPFLLVPDIDAPVSVPRDLIDLGGTGNHLITWLANPETDLMGYRLHHGSWNGFAYTNITDLGNFTGVVVPDSIFLAGFAITAYDSSATGNQDQVLGHESGFAKLGLFPVSRPGADQAPSPSFQVFPIPASDDLHIRLDRQVPSLRATLYDMSGRIIRMEQGTGSEMNWDLGALPDGLYLLRVEAGKWSGNRKVMVRH